MTPQSFLREPKDLMQSHENSNPHDTAANGSDS
jgi:hypothetical protein